MRALEVSIGSGRPFSSFGPGLQAMRVTESAAAGAASTSPYHLVGLRMDRQLLAARIKWRYDVQLANGFVAEVAGLRSRYGATLSRTAAQALGYREILAYLKGECSLDEAVGEAVRRTVHFAKRQERWFRRDPRIHWLDVDRLVGETPEAQAVADPSLKGNAATVQMAALADWVLADWRR